MIDPLSRHLHQTAGQHGPVMLMYHAVMPGKIKPEWPWAVSMQQFRDQLDFLVTEGYATPTMGELIAAPGEKGAGRTAVITFDDGYIDNLAACEELQKRGMRASWFIVTGSIGISYGIEGVAYAIVGTFVYSALHMYWLAASSLQARWLDFARALIPASILNAILAAVLFLVHHALPATLRANDLLYIALMGLAGGLAYVLCFLYLPITALLSEQIRWKTELRLTSGQVG